MDVRPVEVSILTQIYPQFSERIEELYRGNPDFKALCQDYILCKTNLKEFQRKLHEKQTAIKDYEEVTADLERELMQFLFERGSL